jgi:formylglycine-generating enzyme required for sulfatase activity
MNPKTLTAVMMAVACSASLAQAQLLYDDFTGDSALDTSIWTVQSSLLNSLAAAASTPALTLVPPVLGFGPSGLQMSGVTNIYEFTAIQSVSDFAPPFTLSATVNGLVAAGFPFAIYLVSGDLSQWLSIGGNVGANNGGYYGMWVNYTGSGKTLGNRGVSLFASPNTNVWYTLQISIGSDGAASAAVSDGGGVEGVLSGLAAGMGPYYIFLGQKEGYPAVPGPNVALWQSVELVAGQTPPPVPPPLSLNLGLAPVWSTNGMNLELRGPSGSYLAEALSSSSISYPMRWQTVQTYATSNWSFRYDFTDSSATNYSRSLYRARQLVAPTNMVLIPSGPFVMGDASDSVAAELPLHTNQIGTFYIDQYDVTQDLWEAVRQWSTNHGYGFSSSPAAKAHDHPEQSVTWYDCVKWCNARSEMEGRTPAYYTDATWTAVYRTGNLDLTNACVLWSAGYRLPTEAEWEAAARGGLEGNRFPWGDTISESQANYDSDASYSYDLSDTGYNPTYNDGVQPYTSPVGSFASNALGLYDMAGNVWQWCWDWYGGYSSNPQSNPRGPDAGTVRVCRGGSWQVDAYYSRTACRGSDYPYDEQNDCGFRTVIGMER